jgi:1,4-alpha-glucan branching enzyme
MSPNARGFDLSPNMVQEYNTRVGQSTTVLKISASVGNFLDPTDSSPEGFESEEFHNLEDSVLAATRLAARLKEGSCLLIIDFLLNEKYGEGGEEGDRKESRNSHRHCHGFGKHHECGSGDTAVTQTKMRLGVGEEEMRDIFRSAGVGKDFDFEVIAKGAMFETPSCSMIQDVFMARGAEA